MSGESPFLIADCPRCGIGRITFDILAEFKIENWTKSVFCRCRECGEGSTFIARIKHAETIFSRDSEGRSANFLCNSITLQKPKFENSAACPEFVPPSIAGIFDEAAMCRAFGCYSASGAMFRKVIDQATRTLVDAKPVEETKDAKNISWKVFKDLRLRLNWLITQGMLPNGMNELVECVREDGNDAAHALESIGLEGALDLEDFSKAILEFLFTMPGKIARNIERRTSRREMGNEAK